MKIKAWSSGARATGSPPEPCSGHSDESYSSILSSKQACKIPVLLPSTSCSDHVVSSSGPEDDGDSEYKTLNEAPSMTDDVPAPSTLATHVHEVSKKAPAVSRVLRLWTEATAVTIMHGSHTVAPVVWSNLAELTTSVAPTMTLTDIVDFLAIVSTALHRCGSRLDLPSSALTAVADACRTAFGAGKHSNSDILGFQVAMTDVLSAVAMLGGAEARAAGQCLWGEALLAKFLPLLEVGMAAVFVAFQIASLEEESGRVSPQQKIQNAIFFAEALSPLPWCPSSLRRAVIESLAFIEKRPKKQKPKQQQPKAVKRRFLCFGTPHRSVTPTTSTTPTTASRTRNQINYSLLLEKIHSRALTVATWLQRSAPLSTMTPAALDGFSRALVVASGDDARVACALRAVLLCCADKALHEVVQRVRRATTTAAANNNTTTAIHLWNAERLAVTARKHWEGVIIVSDNDHYSSDDDEDMMTIPATTTSAAAAAQRRARNQIAIAAQEYVMVLEEFVALRENEEMKAVAAEIARATAAEVVLAQSTVD